MKKKEWELCKEDEINDFCLQTSGECIWFTEIKSTPVDWELYNGEKLVAIVSKHENRIVNYGKNLRTLPLIEC